MTTPRTLAVLALIGGLAGTALAEPAAPDPAEHAYAAAIAAPEKETVAFLGVSALPASGALGSQLRLPAGVGLVLHYIVPDSPAAEAGLQRHDLLHKLDDQLLINGEQLAVLVRTYEPGDTVTLTVIRAGQSLQIAATLAEHEQPVLGPGGQAFGARALQLSMPQAAALHRKYKQLFDPSRLPHLIAPQRQMLLRWDDDQQLLVLKTAPDGTLKVATTDRPGGNVSIVEGQEIDDLPEPVRAKVRHMLELIAPEAEEAAETP